MIQIKFPPLSAKIVSPSVKLPGSGGHKVIKHGFYHDSSLDFQTRCVLGLAVHGASEVGEVLATVARIDDEGDWAREWSTTAQRVEAEAEQARDATHMVSASSGFLRAASYWACAVEGPVSAILTKRYDVP